MVRCGGGGGGVGAGVVVDSNGGSSEDSGADAPGVAVAAAACSTRDLLSSRGNNMAAADGGRGGTLALGLVVVVVVVGSTPKIVDSGASVSVSLDIVGRRLDTRPLLLSFSSSRGRRNENLIEAFFFHPHLAHRGPKRTRTREGEGHGEGHVPKTFFFPPCPAYLSATRIDFVCRAITVDTARRSRMTTRNKGRGDPLSLRPKRRRIHVLDCRLLHLRGRTGKHDGCRHFHRPEKRID